MLNCWTLIVGAYSRWALIRGWALIKFSPFSPSVVCLFCNKIINGNNKKQRCNNAGFCKILGWKLRLRKGLLLSLLCGREWGGGGHLSTFSAFRMGAYSRWVLIWGWALNWIISVIKSDVLKFNSNTILLAEYISKEKAA